ncbi:hypothetical protein PFISCL1PPCAC_24452, partial [Pristionchus fissidentatus]
QKSSMVASISHSTDSVDEVSKLREQVRQLTAKVTTLTRDYDGLKERVNADKLCFSEHFFSFNIVTATFPDTPYLSESVELNGVNLTLHSEVVSKSDGTKQIAFWFDLLSNANYNATLITKCNIVGYGSSQHNTGPFTQIVRLKDQFSVASTRHFGGPWDTIRSNMQNVAVKFAVKLVRPFNANSIAFDAGENYVTVAMGEVTLQVNAPYVSEWSAFLRAYFTSQMREGQQGVYPIEDCAIDDFREMLDVIYPTSKPINNWNVHKMLDLADRFIMPMLTNLCEVFLNDDHKHTLSEIEMLILADKYNLFLTRTNVLEKLTTTGVLRSKIIKTEGYDNLSYEMKRFVDTRYVELDVQERK